MTAYESEELEAIQAVIDRVSAYQDGATEGTVEQELKNGFDEADVEVGSDDLAKLVEAIDADAGDVSAQEILR